LSNKEIIKYLTIAAFQANCSKALNKVVGACLVPVGGEVPIGSYNGCPRKIEERFNWDRFSEEEHQIIWQKAIEECGEPRGFPHNKTHPNYNKDPRYLLGYKPGTGLKYMIDVHAEQNAIFNAARAGVSTVGAKLYLTCAIPCKECTKAIIQAGIGQVYALESTLGLTPDNSEYNYYLSRWLFKNSPVELIEYRKDLLKTAINNLKTTKLEKLLGE
jgi:deoxycytidylate deaminase